MNSQITRRKKEFWYKVTGICCFLPPIAFWYFVFSQDATTSLITMPLSGVVTMLSFYRAYKLSNKQLEETQEEERLERLKKSLARLKA